MGKAVDSTAFVDARLRVRSLSGLRVVDASIVPAITRANTNSPTSMIAEKAARWIMEASCTSQALKSAAPNATS